MFFNVYLFILRDKEQVSRGGAEREREREGERGSQAGSMLSAQSRTWCSNSRTVRSWPEPKSGVSRLTD